MHYNEQRLKHDFSIAPLNLLSLLRMRLWLTGRPRWGHPNYVAMPALIHKTLIFKMYRSAGMLGWQSMLCSRFAVSNYSFDKGLLVELIYQYQYCPGGLLSNRQTNKVSLQFSMAHHSVHTSFC